MKMSPSMIDPPSGPPPDGFEGPEKKLEVVFRSPPTGPGPDASTLGFRSVPRCEWDVVLRDAQCTIISVVSNYACDAYLLSESSLFVYANKIMIKTCGTTTLLRAVPHLLAMAERLGLEIDFLRYSRASFLYPAQQLSPHTSFEEEVEYLDRYFPRGTSCVLGTLDQATEWHVYMSDETRGKHRDQSMEIFMFELDRESMERFIFLDSPECCANGSEGGRKLTTSSGIRSVLEYVGQQTGSKAELVVDAYNFDPCGYSLNAIQGQTYFSIHITPEAHCSYVSFECSAPMEDCSGLVSRVIDVFKPGKFAVGFLADALSSQPTGCSLLEPRKRNASALSLSV